MPITYRPVTPDEFEAFDRAELRGFAAHPRSNPEMREFARRLFEPDRSIAAFDGDLIVGTAGSFPFEISVPGGTVLRMGGTSHVTVSPTHRRRGILTQMMRRQLDGYRERGEPLAALWASETPIYGRFGYGIAVIHERREIERRYARLAHAQEAHGQIRFIDKGAAAGVFAPIHRRACVRFPGMIARNDLWWDFALFDERHARGQAPALFHAVYEVDGSPRGYVMYRVRHNWENSIPQNVVEVHEMVGDDDEATAALWRFCLGIDLSQTIRSGGGVPVDDGLPWMLADPRRLSRRPYDGLWLRLIDVPAALAARTYAQDGAMNINLDDAYCAWNAGVWRLEGGPAGADCQLTGATPDIAMSAGDLASIYMGGVKPSELARAGRVEECVPGALALADRMFATTRLPWNLVDF